MHFTHVRNLPGSLPLGACRRHGVPITPATIIHAIRQWNARKEHLFTEVHVDRALQHLGDLNWLNHDDGDTATATRGLRRPASS